MSEAKTRSYMIWITSPASPNVLFTLHISPSFGSGTIVRQTHYEDEEALKTDLIHNLPPIFAHQEFVSLCVESAKRTGMCDWREIDIRLNDAAARNLGWTGDRR
jgi:hypothetical protein